MSHELDPDETGTLIESESRVEVEENPNGSDSNDGEWQPVESEVEEDRDGCELIDGVWVEKSMSNEAGVVEGNFMLAVKLVVKANKLGFVFAEPGMYQLIEDQPKRWRKPDLSFVRFGRFPNEKIPKGRMRLAPDLALEVISPSDKADDVQTKLIEYLRAGVRLVWFAYTPTKTIWAYRPDGTARVYFETDTLTGEDVLPGFAVPVAELFEGV